MSRYSTSAKKVGSTHVAFGDRLRLASLIKFNGNSTKTITAVGDGICPLKRDSAKGKVSNCTRRCLGWVA